VVSFWTLRFTFSPAPTTNVNNACMIFQFLVDPYSTLSDKENVQVFNPLSQDSDVSIWLYCQKTPRRRFLKHFKMIDLLFKEKVEAKNGLNSCHFYSDI
jgi:hypothetical protein